MNRLTVEIVHDTDDVMDDIRSLVERCRHCHLSAGGAGHMTLSECEGYLARDGEGPCRYPEEHHEYESLGRVVE